jgi:hypothetical protein
VSATTKLYSGILFLSLVTVESGGYFLLRILSGKEPGKDHPVMLALFRAGHAHAGVLVILALVAAIYIEHTRYSIGMQRGLRVLFFAAPLLMSGGFFGAAATLKKGAPGGLIALTFVGAACLALALVLLGVGLIRSRGAANDRKR